MLGKPIGIAPVPDYLSDNAELVKRHDELERQHADLKRQWDDLESPPPPTDESVRGILESQSDDRETIINLAETEVQLRRNAIQFTKDLHAAHLPVRERARADAAAIFDRLVRDLMELGFPEPKGMCLYIMPSHPELDAANKFFERLRKDSSIGGKTTHDERCLSEVIDRIHRGDMTRWRDPYALDSEREKRASPYVAACYYGV